MVSIKASIIDYIANNKPELCTTNKICDYFKPYYTGRTNMQRNVAMRLGDYTKHGWLKREKIPPPPGHIKYHYRYLLSKLTNDIINKYGSFTNYEIRSLYLRLEQAQGFVCSSCGSATIVKKDQNDIKRIYCVHCGVFLS